MFTRENGDCAKGLYLANLVRSKAVVELDNSHLVPPLAGLEARLGKNLVGTGFRHVVAHDAHRAFAFKGRGIVCGHGLAYDLYCLIF